MVIALTAIYLVLTKCVRRPELLLTAQCGVLTKCVRRPELLLTAQCGAATQLGNSAHALQKCPLRGAVPDGEIDKIASAHAHSCRADPIRTGSG
ncbi:hypothetical protein NDU88_010675 [Pleurodeles waltl]|uniref:Secreted protein n=1 Tax=Pleurodeles waltl TaxID=8319 RepID=A0AAV7RYW7_PLEWA|nr:hypothetical protein NDU88_010675 [Pleurodeles waltl]